MTPSFLLTGIPFMSIPLRAPERLRPVRVRVGQIYTNLRTHGIMEASQFGYNDKPSFGLLTFDTVGVAPLVTYQIVNIEGQTMHELEAALADLWP